MKSKSGKTTSYKLEISHNVHVTVQSKTKGEHIKKALSEPNIKFFLATKRTASRVNYYLKSNSKCFGRLSKTDYNKIKDFQNNDTTNNWIDQKLNCDNSNTSNKNTNQTKTKPQKKQILFDNSRRCEEDRNINQHANSIVLADLPDYADPRVYQLELIHKKMLKARAAGETEIARNLETIGRLRVKGYTIEAEGYRFEAEGRKFEEEGRKFEAEGLRLIEHQRTERLRRDAIVSKIRNNRKTKPVGFSTD